MDRRPTTKTIKKVFEWLDNHGLSVYGANIDPETGQEFDALRDFTAEQAIKVCRLLDKGKTWREGYDD